MRISLERSGGFAGLRRPILQVETKDLPPGEATALEELVEQAGFFQLPEQLPAPKNQADRFQYSLTITDDQARTHTVTFSEGAATGPLGLLVQRVLFQKKRAS